jgi:predicted nuclease with TOPRIM domain
MQRRSVPRTDPRYNQIRAKNNDSVKKSREKSRRERDETVESINQLEQENEILMENIRKMKQEYEQLQELFKKHTGISLDQLMSSQTNSTSTSSIQPKPIEEPPKETSSTPILTINTNEDKTATTPSDVQLDPNTLDGAIVLINGIQYKIVSMNKT